MTHDKKNAKIIPFPHLKDRLVEKGMSSLKEKKYQEALELFSEAMKYDDTEADLHLGMAICFLELGELEEAKSVCEKMLKEGYGHYFTVLQVYMTILIQLKKYEEVKSTIEAVLEENQLPAESAEQFYKLLDFSRKMTDPDREDEAWAEEYEDTIDTEKVLASPEEQMNLIHSLKDRNVAKYIGLLKTILQDPSAHPIIKTMIVMLLAEHEYSKPVHISKFGESLTIEPSEIVPPDAAPILHRVLRVLDETLGNENPTLYAAVEELWRRHLYVLYPFQPKLLSADLWAAALHKVGYEMHGIEIEREELHMMYEFTDRELDEACTMLKDIEEISYL
ncbi:DNA damage checkpoint antagonist DdcA [Bacillus subtilis]|uniref:tetratricopeptide repeat protein n=1 Tax=Bacillus subtilis TaxID=1423 RepID=UPI001C236583|nr:tetratricopeptide repeat protein [Bacillus subtilis]MBU8570392.1 DNA damage checkpoint antagonist DdcA [Bacillus subtilis]MBU8623403.1 DNA damage checkpoint antagonist DdcA [Bacillus subtilis]